MAITASTLRANIYRLIDEALETGVPVEVVRNGRMLKLIPEDPPSKLANLKKRSVMNCEPEELVHINWEKHWKSDGPS